MANSRRKFRLIKRLALVVLVLAGFSVFPVVALRWFDPPTTAFMQQRQSVAIRAEDSGFQLQHSWAELDTISPWLGLAVIAAEDQRFPYHRGFDVGQIQQAWNDAKNGGRRRGASTITQQLSKNLFLWSGRNQASKALRKGLEIWFTTWLELCLPKRRILELYLNVAEFGNGIYGAEAAARHYFGKSAASLTPRESALLAAVLPSPKRYRINPPSAFIEQRVSWITQQGRQLGGPAVVEDL